MGRFVVEELQRFIAGRPLEGAVSPAMTRYTSHRPVFSNFRNRVGAIEAAAVSAPAAAAAIAGTD